MSKKDWKLIRVTEEMHEKLRNLGKKGEAYNSIVEKLYKHWLDSELIVNIPRPGIVECTFHDEQLLNDIKFVAKLKGISVEDFLKQAFEEKMKDNK